MPPRYTLLLLLLPMLITTADARKKGFIYEESEVPAYTLPDPLIANDGSAVTSAAQWTKSRREEVLEHFEQSVYGRRPDKPEALKFTVTSQDENALGGLAKRKQVSILFEGGDRPFAVNLLVYVPNKSKGPAPVFLGYNFNGNHSINVDPGIDISKSWMRKNENGNENHRATEAARGKSASRWPVETILKRGYAVATAYYGDVEPDHADGWKDGIRSFYKTDAQGRALKREDWSAITAWAWALSRIVDYLETDGDIDADHIALLGHSRLGKTSVWAGATDERFAITISNNSGCGGAALSRRSFGETVKQINTSFPHWFNSSFKAFNANEGAIPVDQHELLALIAPRPVYVASAVEDEWADPNGEFLSAKAAGPVYKLFGKKGVGVSKQPAVDSPVGDTIGYHVRSGGHNVTDFDWEQYLSFADRHFGR